jgi:hypothetical protein
MSVLGRIPIFRSGHFTGQGFQELLLIEKILDFPIPNVIIVTSSFIAPS